MSNIFFIVFRRMRQPLITLVVSYAVAVLGLVLIPGIDDQGRVWHMDFFHAFYFVSFMSTTIGFGEIPYAFSEAQRMWVTFAMYSTVIVWVYAIGTLLSLVQDKTFQEAMTERRFARHIRRITDPFYIVCGYGETGSALIYALTNRHQHAVAIDIDETRISVLKLDPLRQFVPGLHGDASRPQSLIEAGLKYPLCRGVVAVTNVNEVNLKIALISKLLNPEVKVICRADSKDVESNMASFGTDHIIDPFDTFARHLAIALESPGLYLLQNWLTGVRHQQLDEPVYPPSEGYWIVCGYGRFGKAVIRRLISEGIHPKIVEATPEKTGLDSAGFPREQWVVGWGTEANTLEEAGVENAIGLVAGTDNDSNNLSIIMTAKALNPKLFIVARQNLDENKMIFDAVGADLIMHPSSIIANKIRVLLGTPLLYEFISLAMYETDAWACELISRITAFVYDEVPEVWEVELRDAEAHALLTLIKEGQAISMKHLLTDPRERERGMPMIPLLLIRSGVRHLLPESEVRLEKGDHILFCGKRSAKHRMEWTLQNIHALNYVRTGQSRPGGWLWRQISDSKA